MKRIYNKLALPALSGLMLVFLAMPVSAQRGGGHSGGGGGSRGGGGGMSSGGGGGSRGGGSVFSGGGSRGSVFSGGGNRSNNSIGPQASGGYSSPRGQMHAQPNFGTSRSYGGRNQLFGRGNAYNGSRNQVYSRPGLTSRYSRPGYNSFYNRGGYYRGGRYYPGNAYSYNRGYYGGRYYGRLNTYGRYNGFFHYNRGFYGSLYYPRLGFSLGILPYGYYPFYWGNAQYYYSDGYFYQQNNNQYTVVEPPVGAAVNVLPENAESIVINGEQYYEANGVYYQPIRKDDGTVAYQVAGKDGQLDTSNVEDIAGPTIEEPQIGDVVSNLPPDARKVKLAGQNYYVTPDDFYYQETRDVDGNKAYKVVGTPTDEPGN